MEEDRYGLPLSTASAEAAAAYREGIDLLLAFWPGAAAAFERAIMLDPEFALAHAARARIHAIYMQREAALQTIARARDLVAKRGTAREQSHVATLSLAIEGRGADALTSTLTHLASWPRDAMVMALPLGAFGLLAFSGRADHDAARRDLCDRFAGAYGEDWWFMSNHGWALTEAGELAKGRAVTERSFALRRHNAYAVHALLHAMFEDGAVDEADALVEGWIGDYDRTGMLHGHIRWHQALGALDKGDAARAIAIHLDVLSPAVAAAPPLNTLSDCASLLWRLSLEQHPIAWESWKEIDAYARTGFPTSRLPFVEMHRAMISAVTEDDVAVNQRLRTFKASSDSGSPASSLLPRLYRAFQAFYNESYRICAEQLAPVQAEMARLGGSHAQREVIEDTYILSLIRSGSLAQARDLLDARLHRRPSARDTRWRALTVG
ncbi:tetratricopeptide repeat protein 38 family protein [Bradyrhizobium sp. SSBR45G]|uniref:tetratricopeptide repeat protein n=1 Tax=unclassified Bradyrhizobium TaxID=2631580 RepID=UPI002342A12B|nr:MULTISPECIES: tetratricopeptide repeat protein [unclassified Bradyrhizobium]GLH79241.1 tetratricopeptide repeat protein 38 family protein [Bradyrhizobium sp. SSBR45G]GLH84676.1 tetratricopeptide repeat protein 38 family protein [Bradyrhizobium sp. SSBR45R]